MRKSKPTMYLITRIDFSILENQRSDALSYQDIGIIKGYENAQALVKKYEKATEPFRYESWESSIFLNRVYPQFYIKALCNLKEGFLTDAYHCQKHGHAPVAATSFCLSCGLSMFEMEKEEND